MIKIAESLTKNTTLTYLNLGRNILNGSEKAIANLVKTNNILIYLHLGECDFMRSEMEQIIVSLQENKSILYLNLRKNRIDIPALQERLSINKYLLTLDLSKLPGEVQLLI